MRRLLLPLLLLAWSGAASAQSTPNCPATVDASSLGRAELSCRCPAEAMQQGGTVWGTDTYTSDSAICVAAQHAGAVTPKGGDVRLRLAPGQQSYRGSSRNDVQTQDYGPYGDSITFVQGPVAAGQVSQCPNNMSAYAGSSEVLNCACSAAGGGSVWGSDVYTADSDVCRAAVHAGFASRSGGTVRVQMMPGQPRYAGSTRNGIATANYGDYRASFRFEGDRVAGAQAPPTAGAQACPDDMQAYSGSTEVVRCACSAEAAGRSASVWGSETYTADSGTCRAALHAGMISRQGGPVVVEMGPGQPRYAGSTRNGVSTDNYGEYRATFRFQGERVAGTQGPPTGMQACPDNMSSYDGTTELVRCACSPQDMARSTSVWGSDAYTADSGTCRAALHAGALRSQGGEVSIRMLPGLPRYVGITRNGVQSSNYQSYRASFRFEGMETSGPQLCPDNMSAYAGTTETLRCVCTGEAVLRRSAVWGTNAYTADSATCPAARHAGVVAITGGIVELKMQPGDPRYPGSTANGVTTSNYDAYPAGFRFLGGRVTAAGAPMQAPVAAALRQQGRVSLYITFRTNSADLDISAAPVLTQVREAMQADPAMRLRLVGHTDNQGGANINVPLSQRRAASVQAWLVQNGVPAARLSADGRGQNEPIADNTTDAGRSLNRRVEAVRVD